MLNIVGKRKIFYSIFVVLNGLGLLAMIFWGLHFGIDFHGGSLIEIEFSGERPPMAAVKEKVAALELGDASVQPAGEKGVLIRMKDLDEPSHRKVLQAINASWPGDEKRFDSIGPVIGQELKNRAFQAIGIVLLLIVFYIAYAFRKVSRPVASWKYGVAAIVALFHDVLIPTGVFSILGHYFGVEIDLLFVTGILTVLGFSVHDTIVVFDRIRENLRKGVGNDFADTVNVSINQTITRSINTSLTVFLTLLAIYIFGGQSTRYFALLLMMGVFFGTYSSIFVASSLLVSWESWGRKRIAGKPDRG